MGKLAIAISTLPSTLPHGYILTFTLYLYAITRVKGQFYPTLPKPTTS